MRSTVWQGRPVDRSDVACLDVTVVAAFDPYSRRPSYEYCVVQIRKADRCAD